jgi:hypothetical protein
MLRFHKNNVLKAGDIDRFQQVDIQSEKTDHLVTSNPDWGHCLQQHQGNPSQL